MNNYNSSNLQGVEFETPENRRMTRVLSSSEIQFSNYDDVNLNQTNPRCPSPRPESMCTMVQEMTSEQVQELLHRMNITDDSSQDEGVEQEKVIEQADEKSQAKPKKKKAPAKKVPKGNTKNIKTDLQVQNADIAGDELLHPSVKNSAPEETKIIKTKRGKKNNTIAENLSLPTSDYTEIISKDEKKDLDEEIVVKKKRGTKVKQNSATEINNEDLSIESAPKQESNIDNDEKKHESEIGSKNKKANKKTKQTQSAQVEKPKEVDKKLITKVALNDIKKDKPEKSLDKLKDEASVVKGAENASEIKNIEVIKPTRTGRGKQKNTEETLKGSKETIEKELDSKIGEEPNKGRAKRNTKKEAKEVVDEVTKEPEVVKEVQKSKKKTDAKQKENQDPEKKTAPKNKPTSKADPPPTREKKPINNKGSKTSEEEVPAPKRPTRKVVK
uniref:Uncharacterized protein n=1 Tax=Graphocephala atropunctata TaxID=36148 RepID=A0A1B6LE42_9HEMI